jgi:phage/plasmid-like protein (TIGR03299 family)
MLKVRRREVNGGWTMPHNIQIENDRAAMFYVLEKPWHKLGTELREPPTGAEAIRAAQLDWKVEKKPIFAGDGKAQERIERVFAIVREDLWKQGKRSFFGIVSDVYTPLQNVEAFDFFDPIIKSGAATYETAGALGDGERIWILAKLDSAIELLPDDRVDKYLLLSNSHDGHSSVQIKFTPIRVVCQNTLTLALSKGPGMRVGHTRGLQARLREAEQLLERINNRYIEIETLFRQMLEVQMPPARRKEYLELVFPMPSDTEDSGAIARVHKEREAAAYLSLHGRGNQTRGIAGTLWASYNGVTEYVDYYRGQPASSRLNSIWFGDGYSIKARAFDVAERQIGKWLN